MTKILLTGGTGLVGASVARMLLGKGYQVRCIVRNPASTDADAIRRMGVEVVRGDISNLGDVLDATKGVDGVIHSAAMLGGPDQTMENCFSANCLGTIHVHTAAARLGVSPVVQLITTTYFDMWDSTLTETSPLDLKAVNLDPYSVTKRLAFVEGMARAGAGQDIRFVVPGGVIGPSPCVERAMTLPSLNAPIASAIRGAFDEIVAMPIPWVYVDDVADVSIRALERGRRGERYIAHGRQDEVGSIAWLCNQACEIAGVPHRVREVPKERLDDPDIRAKYGDSWADLGKTSFPEPWSDSRVTEDRLGYVPSAIRDGLKTTVDWLRAERLI